MNYSFVEGLSSPSGSLNRHKHIHKHHHNHTQDPSGTKRNNDKTRDKLSKHCFSYNDNKTICSALPRCNWNNNTKMCSENNNLNCSEYSTYRFQCINLHDKCMWSPENSDYGICIDKSSNSNDDPNDDSNDDSNSVQCSTINTKDDCNNKNKCKWDNKKCVKKSKKYNCNYTARRDSKSKCQDINDNYDDEDEKKYCCQHPGFEANCYYDKKFQACIDYRKKRTSDNCYFKTDLDPNKCTDYNDKSRYYVSDPENTTMQNCCQKSSEFDCKLDDNDNNNCINPNDYVKRYGTTVTTDNNVDETNPPTGQTTTQTAQVQQPQRPQPQRPQPQRPQQRQPPQQINKQDDSDFWWILGTLIIFFLVLVGFGYKYKDSLKSEFNKIFLHGDKDVKVASKIKKPQTLNTSQIQ